MFDVEAEIATNMRKLVDSGKLASMVEESMEATVQKLVKETVGSAFSWRTDGRNAIEKSIQEALKIQVGDLGLKSYAHLILTTVKNELDTLVNSLGVQKAKEAVQQLLADSVPERIKFSEIIEKFIDEEIDHETRSGEISLHIDDHNKRLVFISFDEEEGKESYACSHRLVLHQDGRIHSYENKTYRGFGKRDQFYNFMFKLYSAGTIIEDVLAEDPEDLKCFDRED